MNFKDYLKESSLSRILSKLKESDTGTITAFRSQYSKKENVARNKKLLAQLRKEGYSVTAVDGRYTEAGQKPSKERSFFVQDMSNKGNLKDVLKKLGAEYDQDSILFIPLGGEKAMLIGTNDDPENFLKKGQEKLYPKRQLGKPAMFDTTVNGRPYSFIEESLKEYIVPKYPTEIRSVHLIAESDWKELI